MIGTTHDERAQQQFVLALNRYVQGTLADGCRRLCEDKVAPAHGITSVLDGHDRQRLRRHMEREALYQFWLGLMQSWQDLLWRYTGACVDRQLGDLVEQCRPRSGDRGTLKLDPGLALPRYQAAVDNHSLPGGYHTETRPDDVRQGAIYSHSATLYLLGNTGIHHDYRGHTLISHLRGRFPQLAATRVLDLGCLVGASTAAYCRHFPDARICAVDTSAPGLRFGHGIAESRGLTIHFSQQSAEALQFQDESFDLVVSHALLHETSRVAVRNIFGECFRVLRPGGVMAHIEVPARLDVMSPWDYLRSSYEGFYNQEPFWNGLAETDLVQIAEEAGFARALQGFQQTSADGAPGPAPESFKPVERGRMDLSNWFVCSAVKPGGQHA